MKTIICWVVFLIMCNINLILSQQEDRDEENYVTEIIIGKESNGEFEVVKRFNQNEKIELDYEESFFLIIRRKDLSNPYEPIPIGAVIKSIEITTQFKGKIYTPKVISRNCEIVSSRVPLKCEDVIPIEVKNQINTRNISELYLSIRVNWRVKQEVSIECKNLFPTNLDKQRVDAFNIDVKHFGLIVLVDLSPISNNTGGAVLDVLLGIVYNLTYTSLDYAYVTRDNNFKNLIVTAPIIRFEGREWAKKNIEGQFVLVKDAEDNNKFLGYGVGLGFLGETKILKAGMFWYNKEAPRYFLGVSIVGLSKWLF